MVIDVVFQFLILFGITMIISILAITRETMTLYLFSGILWFAFGLAAMTLTITVLTASLGFLGVGFGLVFIFAFLKALGETMSENKRAIRKPSL